MTQEELEYNKMCCSILGWLKPYYSDFIVEITSDTFIDWLPSNIYGRTMNGKYQFDLSLCKFHSDWNWIMKVVDIIEKKSEHIIMGRPLYNSFDIGNRNIKFYFSPNNKYLLQLELKQVLSDEPWIHTMYKHHIIQQFDFKTKGKKEAVVQAINQFLIWYNNKK